LKDLLWSAYRVSVVVLANRLLTGLPWRMLAAVSHRLTSSATAKQKGGNADG